MTVSVWVPPEMAPASQMVEWQRIPLPVQETQEMWVRSLSQEEPLEQEGAPYSSIPAWKIPQTEEPGRATLHRVAKSQA